MTPEPNNNIELPFVFNRTNGLWSQGPGISGDYFDFQWSDSKKQALIRGDKIDAEFLKWIIDRPKYGPRRGVYYPEYLDENALFIDPDYALFAEIQHQFFRVDRIGGEVALVALDTTK